MKKYKLVALAAFCVLLVAGVAWASTSQTPSVDWDVVGGGGAHLEQGNYRLKNTLGQPVVGKYSGGNANLCVGFWCRPAAAPGAPVASFTATPRQGEASLLVDFTDTSTLTPTQWLWAFGDGDTDTVQSPSHTYIDPGTYTVTLTVSNTNGSDTLVRPGYITVTAPGCVPVDSVTVNGPTTGLTDTTYSFVATVGPSNATEPIAYTWSPAPDSGQGTATAEYSWPVTGTQNINVAVSNCSGTGSANDDHQIDIIPLPPGVTPIQDVTISGPLTGTVDTAYAFSAAVEPPTATTPITYTWAPEPDSGQGTTNVTYSWTTGGAKSIAVTAQNQAGGATDDHQIDISATTEYNLYLPVVLRNSQP